MTATDTLNVLFKLLNRAANAKDVQPAERCNSNTCRLIADAYREAGEDGAADLWQGIAELADAHQNYLTLTGRDGAVSVLVGGAGDIWVVSSKVHRWKNGKKERLTKTYLWRVAADGTVFNRACRLTDDPRALAKRIGDWACAKPDGEG